MIIDVFLQEIAFFDITRTGELLSRLSEDTQIIKNAATTNLSEALRNLSTAFIGLGFMFTTSWELTCKHLESKKCHTPLELRLLVLMCMFMQPLILSVGFGCCAGYFCCCA